MTVIKKQILKYCFIEFILFVTGLSALSWLKNRRLWSRWSGRNKHLRKRRRPISKVTVNFFFILNKNWKIEYMWVNFFLLKNSFLNLFDKSFPDDFVFYNPFKSIVNFRIYFGWFSSFTDSLKSPTLHIFEISLDHILYFKGSFLV